MDINIIGQWISKSKDTIQAVMILLHKCSNHGLCLEVITLRLLRPQAKKKTIVMATGKFHTEPESVSCKATFKKSSNERAMTGNNILELRPSMKYSSLGC